MKLVKVFLPVMALMTLPLGTIPAQADHKVKIGVTMASFGHTFHISMMDGMKKWAEAHPDVELSMVDARDDSAKQTGQVDMLPIWRSRNNPIRKWWTVAS